MGAFAESIFTPSQQIQSFLNDPEERAKLYQKDQEPTPVEMPSKTEKEKKD